MFKKTIIAALMLSVISGCTSMSGAGSATADRAQMKVELTENCATLGDKYTPVSYAVDKASKVMVSIQERQCAVFNSYSTLASKHADVAGFLAINADKSDEELLIAMNEFDAAKPENKKIRPQVEAYQNASDDIFDENVELTADITLQVAEIAYIATQNATAIAHDSAGGLLDSILAFFSNESKEEGEAEEIVPIVAAYDELSARSELAFDANTLISMDQDTIEQLKNLDKVLAEKVKA
ncbi:hypothetical protein ACVBIO_11240 [Shewanella sp. 0m-8]